MRRIRLHLGTVLIVVGVALVAYAAAVVFWRDPVTDVYTTYEQHGLRSALNAVDDQYAALAAATPAPVLDPGEPPVDATIARAHVLALRFRGQFATRAGAAIGRIRVGRLGVSMILVQGTDPASLRTGPGHYANTAFPGLGATVAVAGHRTTYAAPFRHIDDLRKGDRVELVMPYGTFVYAVTSSAIVANDDWSIIRDRGYEQLVLSACHPLYSATQRYAVFARLMTIALPGANDRKPVAVTAAAAGATTAP